MSAVPKPRKLTVAEYLAIERAAEYKSEFYDGEMFAMAGASRGHNYVNENLSIQIGMRLLTGPCRSFSRDLRVRVRATGLYTYPDLVIVCGEPEFADEDPDTLVNPRVVFEVLSPSTEQYDRTTKSDHYARLPSVQEYVLVSQDRPRVERYARQADGSWNRVVFDDPAGEFDLTSVPVRVPLADLYRGVTFDELRLR